ncbi:MAG: DJ-1 family glyoxalase III [Spirochaetota bacterium]
MKTVAVLLAEGFEEVEAVTAIDFLRRAGIRVVVAGINGIDIKGSHDIVVAADMRANKLTADLDGVVIPGGMPGAKNISVSDYAVNLIKKLYEKGMLIAAICAAPAVVLEPTGILQGKKATCYPGLEEKLNGVDFQESRVVVDGNIITSRAPGTAAEFAIAIIRYLVGEETAEKIRTGTLQK